MRKTKKLLALLAFAVAGLPLSAETQTPYSYDFNSPIDVTEHDFAPLGWGHLVDVLTTRNGDYYVQYTYSANAGVDGTGCLTIGSQTVSDDLTQSATLNDMLILPPVGGAVSVDVKALNYGSAISFYYINYENGVFTTDGTIDMDIPALSEDSYTTINLPEMPEGTLIGIRGNSVNIDNVKAETADITPYPRMKVLGITSENPEYVDAASDGNFTLKYKVRVRNNGQRDLVAGEDNYSLSLVNASKSNAVVSTTAVGTNLAIGDSTDVELAASLPFSSNQGVNSYSVRDNLTGVLTSVGDVQAYPYNAVATVLDATGNTVDGTIDFGVVQGTTTVSYQLRDDGASPLEVTGVDLTDGFSSTFTPQTVAPHATVLLPITYKQESTSTGSGTLTLTTNAGTKTINLKASGVKEGGLYANFEDGKMAPGFIAEGGWTISSFPQQAGILNNNYCAQNSDSIAAKLITPKLNIAEGDVLHFDASRRDTASYVNVYYSADRANWTLVHTVKGTGNSNTTFDPALLLSDSRTSGAFRSYIVNNIPEGDYYIAFEAGNARVDNIYGFGYADIAHDVIFRAANLPSVATVNSESQADVTFFNARPVAEKAGKYTVSLYQDGVKLTTAAEADFAAGETKKFDLSFTPRTAGTSKIYALYEADGQVVATSDTVTVNILGETANSEIQVGTPSEDYGTDAPLRLYYKNSESDVIYTADQLKLASGTRITKLNYKGYNPSKDLKLNLKVYAENTDSASYTADGDGYFAPADTSKMTKIYDGIYTVTKSGSISSPADMLNIVLTEPFTYTGKNLRIHMISSSSDYSNVRFQQDETISGQSVGRSSDNPLTDDNHFISRAWPVVTISYVGDPTSFTGTVTKESDGSAVEGAVVSLTNANVLYSDTTDAQGRYNIAVYKNDRSYNFRAEAVGFEPYKAEVSDFATPVNAVLKAGHGIYVDSISAPAEVVANHEVKVDAYILNAEATDKAEGSYTARLLKSDGTVAATTDAPALKAGEKAKVTFRFTPHVADTLILNAEFVAHEDTAVSETATLAVLAESLGGTVQVLDSNNIADYAVPVRLYDKNSESQTIYKASDLNLATGSVINKITFKGYQGTYGTPKDYNAQLRVYIENTTDDYDQGFIDADTTQMTMIYDDSLNVNGNGTAKAPADVISITIPGGFKYTGGNLRLVFHAEAQQYARVYFVNDKNVQQTYRRSDDNVATMEASSWTLNASPVMYLDVKSAQTVSGTVTNGKGEAVSGAQVTIKSGDVIYSATTAEDGTYEVVVAQPSLDYDAIFEADGYVTDTVAVDFSNGDVALNHQMGVIYTLSGTVYGKDGNAAATPLAGAEVTVTDANGNEYTTTTDADGKYSVEIRNASGEYTVAVTADEYVADSVKAEMDYADATADVTLNKETTPTAIDSVNVDKNFSNGNVYNIKGQFIGRDIDIRQLPAGLYIVNGKKIAVK